MMLPEPPRHPDDTQPTGRHADTQPMRPGRRYLLPDRLLVLLLIVSGLSLTGTIGLLLLPEPVESAPVPVAVTLNIAGDVRQLETTAATVGDLLSEQAVVLAADDAVSDAPDTPLYAGMTVYVDHARNVSVTIDGRREMLRTPFESPYDVLSQAGLTLTATDRVWLEGTPVALTEMVLWSEPVSEIVVRRAMTVTILDAGEETVIETTAATVGDALFEAGIRLYLTDLVEPDSGSALTDDTTVRITRAQPVTIVDGDETITARVQEGTVADALATAGITLMGMDYTLPPDTDPITPNMTIQVMRVTEEIVSTEEVIPCETVYQADASLELDTRQVVQACVEGIERVDTLVTYAAGVEIGREPAGSEIIAEPVNRVVNYGTNIVLRTIQTPSGPVQYWRKLRVYATSYHPAALGGDNVTATGEILKRGIIGADPKLIPYYTSVYVPDYGRGIIADTGGPRRSRYWIDLGYEDHDYVSWHQYTDIYLLAPVPAEIEYLLPTWSSPHPGIPDNG